MGLGGYVQMAFDFLTASPLKTGSALEPTPECVPECVPEPVPELVPALVPAPVASKTAAPNPTPSRVEQPFAGALVRPQRALERLEYVHPSANRTLEWSDARVHYWLKRSSRKTIGMVVGPKGLEVSAPRWVSVAQILDALTEKQSWILCQLKLMRTRQLELSARALPLSSPLVLPLLGVPMEVVLSTEGDQGVHGVHAVQGQARRALGQQSRQSLDKARLWVMRQGQWTEAAPAWWLEREASSPFSWQADGTGPTLRLVLPWSLNSSSSSSSSSDSDSDSDSGSGSGSGSESGSGSGGAVVLIEDLPDRHKCLLVDWIHAWLSSVLLAIIESRVQHFSSMVGVSWSQIKLSRAATRWGSANARGVLAFNRQLAHVPMVLLDYVVVHELSHFLHMNHSPEFWAVVARVMPDYESRRALLQKTPMPNWQAWQALRQT